MMDPVFFMLFEEVRHALEEIRTERYREAERTLEGVLLVNQLVHRYRQSDPQARRLMQILHRIEYDWTPEGRLEWQRRRLEWNREMAQERLRDPRMSALRAEWVREELADARRPI